jgi:hypothetical protein
MSNKIEPQNCPEVDSHVDSETELIINEVKQLEKRPVGRPKIHFDPNYKYDRKNKYYHCNVCNKTCEYYYKKNHFKTSYHLKKLAEQNKNVETPKEEIHLSDLDNINKFKTFLTYNTYDVFKFENLINSFDYKIENNKITASTDLSIIEKYNTTVECNNSI